MTNLLLPRIPAGWIHITLLPKKTGTLAEAVAAKPDATLAELRDVVSVPVGLSVYCRYLQRMKLTRKKKSIHAQEQERPDVKEQRQRWHADLSDVHVDQLVFIDESGATTDMQRRYGRSAQGERCVAAGPQGHWKVATMIGAIRMDGPVTCAMLDGAVNGESFLAWVREDLCPALRPGDVVVMDNLSAHKGPAVRQTIEAAGAQLMYLPPYSPDYNPIENMWSKTKEALRAAAARTFDALGDAVSAALACVSAEDCRGFFQHAGYAIQNVKTL